MFDPFCDFEERGYLRNKFGEKNPDIIRHLEHSSFVAGIDNAFRYLAGREYLSYADVLETHKILFKDMYPWAGQDRAQTAPDIAIGKGGVLFAHPEDARHAVDYALRVGQDRSLMVTKTGEVMGCLAYGHPFLDGNGRAIMVVHTELSERAGVSVNWSAANKNEYLSALTKELHAPGRGHLDSYLSKFIAAPLGRERLVGHVSEIKGLRGLVDEDNQVAGKVDDPEVRERYKKLEKQRRAWRAPGDI